MYIYITYYVDYYLNWICDVGVWKSKKCVAASVRHPVRHIYRVKVSTNRKAVRYKYAYGSIQTGRPKTRRAGFGTHVNQSEHPHRTRCVIILYNINRDRFGV